MGIFRCGLHRCGEVVDRCDSGRGHDIIWRVFESVETERHQKARASRHFGEDIFLIGSPLAVRSEI